MKSYFSQHGYARAWQLATHHHQGQSYGGPVKGMQIPYINHVASVAMEVIAVLPVSDAVDGDLAAQCALLHDTIEDTEVTASLLQRHFGAAVAAGVQALSKDSSLPSKAAQMADSLRRIKEQPAEVWMVKMADRITNLYHPPYYWDDHKIARYRKEARQIHQALHPASEALALRLEQMIERYRKFVGRAPVERAWFQS